MLEEIGELVYRWKRKEVVEYVAFGIANSFIYITFAINTNDRNRLNSDISYTINTNMATMQEKMAESLAALKAYQDAHGDNLVIHGADVLGRTHTERLVDAGYLTMVLRGWYVISGFRLTRI